MGISTSTGTLTAGQSRTFNLSPASAVTLTLSPNVRVTITETPATVAATGLGGNASRVHEPRLPGVVTYGPYPMGGSVMVEVESNSGSSVAWVRSDSIVAESADGSSSLVDGAGNVAGVNTDWIIPDNYGAVGTADDSAAVVAAAAAAAGKVLKFQPGRTYTFRNLSLPSGVTVDARGATIQYGGSYGTVAPLENVKVVMYAEGSSGTHFAPIKVIGGTWIGAQIPGNYANVTSGSEHDCMQFNYVDGVDIRGAIFKRFQQDAVTFSNCPGSKVSSCSFEDICDGSVELRAGSDYEITGNYFTRVRHMVVNKPNIHNVRVTNNNGSTFQQGIVGHGNDWVIANNTIDVYDTPDSILGNDQPAIEWSDYGGSVTPTDTYRTTITGNTIKNRTNANGIYIKAPVSAYVPYDIAINGNSIHCRRGILFERGVRVSVSGNNILGGAGGGIQVSASNVADLVIDGNTVTAAPSTSGNGVIDVVTPGVIISGNRISTTTAAATGIRLTSAATKARVIGNTVDSTTGVGIASNGVGASIVGNGVTTTAAAAIAAAGASAAINGNNLSPVGGEGVLITAARAAVSGNTITSGSQGVRVSASNCVVNSNTITGCQFWGVNVSSGAVDTLVIGNNYVGNTSGGLTDAGTTTTAANNK